MPTLDADAHLAADELTNMERIEHLLTTVACALTGQPAHVVCPWRSRGIEQFFRAVHRG
jgi:hypothetical protein